MLGTFRIQCNWIRKALVWLKHNNTIYANIAISNEQLDELPVNGIPDEIMHAVRYNVDGWNLEWKHAGYGGPVNAEKFVEDPSVEDATSLSVEGESFRCTTPTYCKADSYPTEPEQEVEDNRIKIDMEQEMDNLGDNNEDYTADAEGKGESYKKRSRKLRQTYLQSPQ